MLRQFLIICLIFTLSPVIIHGASMGLQEQAPFNFIDGETTESFIEEEIIFNSDGVGTFANEVRPDQPYVTGFEKAIRAGRFHEVSCVAKNANPPAEVSWTWDGSPVNGRITTTENKNGTFDVTNVLDFDVKSYHNGNVFVCSVTNDAMENDGELPMEITEVLEVQYQPVIDVSDNDQSIAVFEGNDITVSCRIDANPKVTEFGWSRNFYDVKQNDRIDIDSNDEQPTLRIDNTNSGDKGYYRCQAENDIGETISDPVRLDVLHKPECRAHAIERVGITKGTTGDVECHAEAYPNDAMVFSFSTDGGSTWSYENGVRYYADDPNYGYATFKYNVSSESDYKNVQFKASNGVGEMTDPCYIQITPPGPAEPPEMCEMKNMSHTSMKFECYEVFRGGSQAFYALQMAVNSYFIDLMNSTVPYFSLINLEPDTAYFFRVCASNKEFWEDVTCSDQFSFTTLNGTNPNSAGSGDASTVSKRVPLIAGGSVLLLLLLGTFVSVLCVWKICGEEEDRQPQEVTLKELAGQSGRCNSIPEEDEPGTSGGDPEHVPEVVYAQVNKATKSTKRNPSTANDDTHIDVDIEDLEGIYDKADYIKRKSEISLGAAAVIAAKQMAEEEEDAKSNAEENRSDEEQEDKDHDGESSGSSSNASRRSSLRSEGEYIVKEDDAEKVIDSERSGSVRQSNAGSARSSKSGSARSSVRSKGDPGVSELDKEKLSRQSIRSSSEHGSENNAFCDSE